MTLIKAVYHGTTANEQQRRGITIEVAQGGKEEFPPCAEIYGV